MKIIRTMLTGTAITIAAGVVAYRFVLTPGARNGVKQAAGTIRDSYRRISEVVEDITGIVVEEDDDSLPNKKDTLAQWAKLGY